MYTFTHHGAIPAFFVFEVGQGGKNQVPMGNQTILPEMNANI